MTTRRRLIGLALASAALVLAGCGEDATAPRPAGVGLEAARSDQDSLAQLVRQLTAARGIGELRLPAPVRATLVRLGRAWRSTRS